MKVHRIYTLLLSTIVASVCVVSGGAEAQEEHESLDDNKSAVVRKFCGEDGKLATCVELPASECEATMRPFVDSCYEKVERQRGTLKRPETAFHSCFWFEFNKKYAQKVQRTEECYAVAKEAFPLQPVPPELEGKMQLLNPPDRTKAPRGGMGY